MSHDLSARSKARYYNPGSGFTAEMRDRSVHVKKKEDCPATVADPGFNRRRDGGGAAAPECRLKTCYL